MKQKAQISRFASQGLLGLGLVLTALVLVVFFYSHFVGEVCSIWQPCISKWTYLKAATPNEIGDTLAGYAGTLAFVWIVVTVCLQAIELREQRLEFEKMADAQQKQVALLVKQGAIFEDEQKQRQEGQAGELLTQLLDAIPAGFARARNKQTWKLKQKMADREVYFDYLPFDVSNNGDLSSFLDNANSSFEEFLAYWEDDRLSLDLETRPEDNEALDFLINAVSDVLKLQADLSAAQRQRVANLDIRGLDTRLIQYQNYYMISWANKIGIEIK